MDMDEKQEWMDEYSKTFNPPPSVVFPCPGAIALVVTKLFSRSFTEPTAGGSQTLDS